jgi:hypothetical protein
VVSLLPPGRFNPKNETGRVGARIQPENPDADDGQV